ncbi:hypothetical protein [Mucilaginibacter gotjawali]|uniref:Outer membrane protein beta-barrel domain-containing protein n=1 Tax=Mucilaginibacter gotjawali TaxID=1550579 RepID=A0A839SM03_9SPHI|nr:hypothetical protein [Mucilaginibacter gotjawali]MBB3058906.1 hypothetical protein [Mucilaginibacter gotjawali]
MKYLSKILLIFILVPFFSDAQSNYKPGFVVVAKGDTLRGFIDYQDWDSNPEEISFKTSPGDKERKTYMLNDINYFSITGLAAYKKYTCSISTDVTNTLHLGEGRDTSVKVATVFLRVLQQGKNLALYSYTDGLKTRFYIGETPAFTPAELVYRIYYDMANPGGRTVNENTYQKQLFALANKYNMLDDKTTARLQTANYEKGDLLTIVSRINQVSKVDFEKKYTDHGKVAFYISAALSMSNTTSSPQSSYSIAGGIPYNSYQPAVAFGLDFIPDPNGRAEFRVDLSVNPSQFNALYKLRVSPYVDARASYNQLGVFLTPQAMYNFYNAPNFKFYLGVGFALTYFNFSKPYFQSQNTSSPDPGFPQESFYFNTLNNAFLFKAGFRIQRNWEIYFNYYTSTAATKGGYFGLNNVLKQAGVSYFFGK